MTPASGSTGDAKALYIVRGDDPSLVGQAVHDLLGSLSEGREMSTVVEEHRASSGDELDVASVIDALMTPPMLTDRRIVVVRDAGRIASAEAGRIAECLAEPVEGVVLVLAAGGGTIPAALVKAAQSAGGLVDTTVGTGRARTQWLSDQLREAPVRLDARAQGRVSEHLGEDLSRLRGLLDTLASAYGEGAAIDASRLEPFLGEAGSVAPWELTDAIAEGETEDALRALGRLSEAGGMHPLAVLAILHRHYESMLRLDGSGATTGEQAASTLGSRSVFPAKKALEQSRRLGSARIGRAMILLAEADLDLRGRSAMAGDAVLEVLVGRLSRLGAARQPSHASGRQRAGQSRRGR